MSDTVPLIVLDKNIDCVVFTGGEDVHPSFYGEEKLITTGSNMARDDREEGIFLEASRRGIPMVGICRGSQFLTVMNGGKLHQHIRNHGLVGTHSITTNDGRKLQVTSTHHQMMIPKCEMVGEDEQQYELIAYAKDMAFRAVREPEVVWYKRYNCLAVQYHPEYMDEESDGWKYFQELLGKYIFNKGER